MVPVILVTGSTLLTAMLGLFISPFISVAAVTVFVPLYAWMRAVTKTDDQRLQQLLLRLRLRTRLQGTRRAWGALTYIPLTLKRR